MVITILEALIALPKIGALISDWINQIVLWRIQSTQAETLSEIADAAALAARASTDAERFAAAEAWQKALSRPRVSA